MASVMLHLVAVASGKRQAPTVLVAVKPKPHCNHTRPTWHATAFRVACLHL